MHGHDSFFKFFIGANINATVAFMGQDPGTQDFIAIDVEKVFLWYICCRALDFSVKREWIEFHGQ